MRLRSLRNSAVVTASISALVFTALPVASAEDLAHFTVSNITDFHGRFETIKNEKEPEKSIPGAQKLKCAVDKAKEGREHVFTSSGDNVGASPFAAMMLDDEPTIDVLNAIGLEVSTVGNHEFDKGAKDFTDRIATEADWTYLAAGAEGLEKNDDIRDYEIKTLDGVKVAFIGGVTEDMPSLVSPAGIAGITWENPVAAINRIADELTKSEKADAVIALPHAGAIPADAWSENVDAVFMGHTHQIVNQTDKTPLIMQTGEYSKGLANVDFSFDRSTKKIKVEKAELLQTAELMACDSIDPELQTIIDTAVAAADEEGKQVIGELKEPLFRGAEEGDKPGTNRGVESQLNNLLANVAKWGVARNSDATPDIGVMNAGGVREDLAAGKVTYKQAFAVQPFGNENTYITLKGADFVEALEQQWQDPEKGRPFLSLGVSDNVSYTYDPTRAQGERISSVLIDNEPIDPNKDYIVAGSTFLLSGGDNFAAFQKGSEMAQLGYVDIQAFTEYLGNFLKGGDAPAPRKSQSNVGVHIDEPLTAGEDVKIDLTSLIYTVGETAKTVTVELGDATATADIDPDFGPAGYNEAGKAEITLKVPENLAGEQQLRITTDAGTDIWVPVTIEGKEGNGGRKVSSSIGSSLPGTSIGSSFDSSLTSSDSLTSSASFVPSLSSK